MVSFAACPRGVLFPLSPNVKVSRINSKAASVFSHSSGESTSAASSLAGMRGVSSTDATRSAILSVVVTTASSGAASARATSLSASLVLPSFLSISAALNKESFGTVALARGLRLSSSLPLALSLSFLTVNVGCAARASFLFLRTSALSSGVLNTRATVRRASLPFASAFCLANARVDSLPSLRFLISS